MLFPTVIVGLILILIAGCKSGLSASSGPVPATVGGGKTVYDVRCLRCHGANGVGGESDSDISRIGAERDTGWLERYTRDPRSIDPSSDMSGIPLRSDEMTALLKYLETFK